VITLSYQAPTGRVRVLHGYARHLSGPGPVDETCLTPTDGAEEAGTGENVPPSRTVSSREHAANCSAQTNPTFLKFSGTKLTSRISRITACNMRAATAGSAAQRGLKP